MENAWKQEIIIECIRIEESCMITSASFYILEKRSRLWRNFFVVVPIILGGIASSQILAEPESPWFGYSAAFLALLAGFFPAIYEALGMEMRVREIANAAASFANLRDEFRRVRLIESNAPSNEFLSSFRGAVSSLENLRLAAPTIPEWCFVLAKIKVDNGDFEYKADFPKNN